MEFDLKPNIGYLVAYTLVVCLGVIQTGWTISGNAATAPVLIAQFGWTEQEAIGYNTLINTSAMVGLTVGCLSAGFSLVYGRNRAIVFWEVVALVGCGLTLIRTLVTICIGRLLIGLASGVNIVAAAKCIDETVPVSLNASFGAATNLVLNFAFMVSMALGFILPTEQSAMLTDQNWRIIFAVPGLIAIVQITLMLTVFQQEPLTFAISQNRPEEAKTLFKKVYCDVNDEKAAEMVNSIKEHLHVEATGLTLFQAMFDRQYRRATWIVFVVNLLCTGSGIDSIMIYATRLLLNLQNSTQGKFPLSPTLGTCLIGVIMFIAGFIPLWTLHRFGRKTLMLFGQLVMGVSFVISAICLIKEAFLASFVLMLCFFVGFNMGIGSIVPIYTAETVVDKAAGLSAGGQFGVSLIWSLTTEFMINSRMQAYGTFFLFGGINLFGFVYFLAFVKETRGLNDKQKKTLYCNEAEITPNAND